MYNLTKPQRLIYDMERFAGGAIAVICGSATREGRHSDEELKNIVNELYRLNAALRTRVTVVDGEPAQSVLPFAPRDIEVLRFADNAKLFAYADTNTRITQSPVYSAILCYPATTYSGDFGRNRTVFD